MDEGATHARTRRLAGSGVRFFEGVLAIEMKTGYVSGSSVPLVARHSRLLQNASQQGRANLG